MFHNYACDPRRLTTLPDIYKTAQGQCGMCIWKVETRILEQVKTSGFPLNDAGGEQQTGEGTLLTFL